jgi:hypothetical protein
MVHDSFANFKYETQPTYVIMANKYFQEMGLYLFPSVFVALILHKARFRRKQKLSVYRAEGRRNI